MIMSTHGCDYDYMYVLKDMEGYTPEICLPILLNKEFEIEYVKKQTPEICLAAVNNNNDAIQFVKEMTFEICMAVVKRGGVAL